MAGFNGFLDATFLPPRNWTLDADLVYQCDTISQDEINWLRECKVRVTDDGKITVPAGYITDLASVPRAAWTFISPFDVARAAVIHDLLYEYINTQYKTSEPPVPKWKIFIAWSSVRIFGRWAINNSAPRHPKVVL